MGNFEYLNNFADALCVFSKDNNVIFKNNCFKSVFSDIKSIDRFKNRFSSDLIMLFADRISRYSPIDMVLESKENFHIICSYQNSSGEFYYYYIYSFNLSENKVVVFKDITAEDNLTVLNGRYSELEKKYAQISSSTNKFSKLQENAQAQVLKMGIINRISLVIRETNDSETIIKTALNEINNLMGSFKTYFSVSDKQKYRIVYSVQKLKNEKVLFEYEDEVNDKIKNKEIAESQCLREFINSDEIYSRGVKRVVIPVYSKNKFLGIISTLTKQRISAEDNKEILQSISVQLASSILQSKLINQLDNKNKKLEKTLKELKETQLQLINSEKLASLGQLVSGVAHEINTPLGAITSNNSLMNKILSSEQVLDNDKLNILKELNNIDIEASERISNIVKSLKRFVRLDEAEFQKTDINKELDLTLKLLVHEIKDKINIVRNYSQVPEIYCSVNMINQVFMNILVNACHNIKDYKGSGEIIISTSVQNDNLIIKIKDTGNGIPAEIQSKIFNTGFTTKKAGIGSGLGLSISKKIIEMHKGSITFTSKEGVGTEFTISIPYKNDKHV